MTRDSKSTSRRSTDSFNGANNPHGDNDANIPDFVWNETTTEYYQSVRDDRELALIRAGLSPQEADVIVSIEAGERPSDIAGRLGVSRQAVSDATRRGKIKMSKAP